MGTWLALRVVTSVNTPNVAATQVCRANSIALAVCHFGAPGLQSVQRALLPWSSACRQACRARSGAANSVRSPLRPHSPLHLFPLDCQGRAGQRKGGQEGGAPHSTPREALALSHKAASRCLLASEGVNKMQAPPDASTRSGNARGSHWEVHAPLSPHACGALKLCDSSQQFTDCSTLVRSACSPTSVNLLIRSEPAPLGSKATVGLSSRSTNRNSVYSSPSWVCRGGGTSTREA